MAKILSYEDLNNYNIQTETFTKDVFGGTGPPFVLF